jgi:PIN domain nuclease of toxin-antitoxin system
LVIGRDIDVRVLLDTHILYWWITGDRPLSASHRALIEGNTTIYVSAVTAWEMSIKVKLGKWPDAAPLLPALESTLRDEGFETLDLTLTQAKLAGSLDLTHRDPFDRMLAAQALDLDLHILTVDLAIARLGCKVV